MQNKLKQAQTFTPRWVTNEMLDLLDQNLFSSENTVFFEPSCGNGEMLIVIIERIYEKLLEKYSGEKEKAIAECLFKFYAVELDDQLIIESRIKIFNYFMEQMNDNFDTKIFCQFILSRCIAEKIENKNFFDLFKDKNNDKKHS